MVGCAVHVLTLAAGDPFAFQPGGRAFRRRVGPPGDDRVWIEDVGGRLPPHVLEYDFCYVYPIDDEEDEPEEDD